MESWLSEWPVRYMEVSPIRSEEGMAIITIMEALVPSGSNVAG
jgi:hypothetical protein